MENDFSRYNHFSKLMGEGSDIDESDDEKEPFLDSMIKNQNMNDTGMVNQPIKLDSNLMSESMIKLIRTIEERIDKERVGPEIKVQNQLCLPSLQNNMNTPISDCDDFSGDPSVMYENYSVKLIDDIEQGLNYLYAKGKTEIALEENTALSAKSNSDRIQLQRNEYPNEIFHPEAQMTNQIHYELGLEFKSHSFDQQFLNTSPDSSSSELEIENELYTRKNLGESKIKKRLGKKVEVSVERYECRECKKTFPTIKQLQQHLDAHAQRRKQLEKNLGANKVLSRKLRDFSPVKNWYAKKTRFSGHEIESSFEKKVICQHCKMKFLNLEDLLCHLRAEHRHRKKHSEEYAYKTKYIRSDREKDLSSQEKNRKRLELNELKSSEEISKNIPTCSHCAKIFSKPDELESHLRVIHRDNFISDVHKFICNHCKETFLTKYDLIQHTEEEHSTNKFISTSKIQNSAPIKFVCRFCRVTFFKMHELKKHLNIAHKPSW